MSLHKILLEWRIQIRWYWQCVQHLWGKSCLHEFSRYIWRDETT